MRSSSNWIKLDLQSISRKNKEAELLPAYPLYLHFQPFHQLHPWSERGLRLPLDYLNEKKAVEITITDTFHENTGPYKLFLKVFGSQNKILLKIYDSHLNEFILIKIINLWMELLKLNTDLPKSSTNIKDKRQHFITLQHSCHWSIWQWLLDDRIQCFPSTGITGIHFCKLNTNFL